LGTKRRLEKGVDGGPAEVLDVVWEGWISITMVIKGVCNGGRI